MNIPAPQDMSDEKAFEADCLEVLAEVSEKRAQIFAYEDIQQQDGKNMTPNATSKEQASYLSKIPCKEVVTTEAKNQSGLYQDKVQGDLRLCV